MVTLRCKRHGLVGCTCDFTTRPDPPKGKEWFCQHGVSMNELCKECGDEDLSDQA